MCERAGKPSSDLAGIFSPVVQFDPSDIARRHIATWNGVQTDTVEVVRREPFEYGFRPSRHLLIMSESGERDDGATVVEGLPKSTLHELSRRLSFVPAGHRYFGWQRPVHDRRDSGGQERATILAGEETKSARASAESR